MGLVGGEEGDGRVLALVQVVVEPGLLHVAPLQAISGGQLSNTVATPID